MPLILPGNVASATTAAYEVANSCRFDGSSSYMHRTAGTATSTTQFTISLWVKKCANPGTRQRLIMGGTLDGSKDDHLRFETAETLALTCVSAGASNITSDKIS